MQNDFIPVLPGLRGKPRAGGDGGDGSRKAPGGGGRTIDLLGHTNAARSHGVAWHPEPGELRGCWTRC